MECKQSTLGTEGLVVISLSLLQHPDRSTWGCADIWYNLEAYANNQIQRYQVRGDPRGFRVDYRIQTEPGTNWRLRVQTVNTGGVSPWSREYTAQTETEGNLTVVCKLHTIRCTVYVM